jgi:hypothetical protein
VTFLDIHNWPKRGWKLALAAAALAPIGLAATSQAPAAFAENGMTLSVGTPALTSRTLLSVPVTVVCAPLTDPTLDDTVSVSVQQANGRSVSTGSTTVSGGPFSLSGDNPFLTCDGVTKNVVTVSVLPDSGIGPFHGGGAIFTVQAFHSAGTCSFFCQATSSESAKVGPTSIGIKG